MKPNKTEKKALETARRIPAILSDDPRLDLETKPSAGDFSDPALCLTWAAYWLQTAAEDFERHARALDLVRLYRREADAERDPNRRAWLQGEIRYHKPSQLLGGNADFRRNLATAWENYQGALDRQERLF